MALFPQYFDLGVGLFAGLLDLRLDVLSACRSNADPDCLGYGSDTHAIDRWFLVSLSNRGEGPWTEKECQRPEPDGSSGTYTDTCTFDEAKAELDVGLHTFPALDCESEIVIPNRGAGPTTDTSRRKQLDRESNNCGDEDTETGCWATAASCNCSLTGRTPQITSG